MNVMELITEEDCAGTSMWETNYREAYTEMYYEAGPKFMKEHMKRLTAAGIQTHFQVGCARDLETVERLVRNGHYMGPLVLQLGGDRRRPRWPQSAQPDGVRQPAAAERGVHGRRADAQCLSAVHHGHRDGLARPRRAGRQSVGPQGRTRHFGPADRARWCGFPKSCSVRSPPARKPDEIYKIGTFYSSVDETLEKNGWLPNPVGYRPGASMLEAA